MYTKNEIETTKWIHIGQILQLNIVYLVFLMTKKVKEMKVL